MREPLPLATIHDAVLDFLRNRDDAVLFGAQAVNAYVDESRMTEVVDILSNRAAGLAEEIRVSLAGLFKIAVRIREVGAGRGFRIYQLREPKNRHLVDVRQVETLPPNQMISEVRVPMPDDLIAQKIISVTARSAQPKGDTDRRDLKVLLLRYPELQSADGPVMERLRTMRASEAAIDEWARWAVAVIERGDDDAGY